MPESKSLAHKPASMGRPEREDEFKPRRKKKQRQSSNGNLIWLLAGGGVLGLLLLVGGGAAAWYFLKGNDQPGLPQKQAATDKGSNQPLAKSEQTSQSKSSTWLPDAVLAKQLGNETNVEGYQLRPPKGYFAGQSSTPFEGAKLLPWAGDLRPDNTVPGLLVMILKPPPNIPKRSLEQFHAEMLKGIENRRKSWSPSAIEQGQINGLTFVRTYWSGTDSTSGKKMHGFKYSAIDGEIYIDLGCQDVDPHHREALKLGEAAALTFKKPK
ncbi:MAG TPA: hypothetical protein VE988_06470 [Gemmataceae bacterium]|nr:hypothetical protein [Gemmataceae bacterium]